MMYDLGKLAKLNEFSYEDAVRNFRSYSIYFDELDKFIREARKYLGGYSPIVVVNSEEIKADFMEEADTIQRRFVDLGMLSAAAALNDLKNTAGKNNPKALTDAIQVFQAETDLVVKKIAAARTPAINIKTCEEITILAVDDRPEILKLTEGMLNDRFNVLAVTSGAEALSAVQSCCPSLFLLDIEMPDMNGLELAKMLREQNEYKNTPVIFMTDHATREYVLMAKELGNCDYLLKPVEKSLITEKIGQIFTTLGIL